jgi:hypothetical protein
LGVGTSARAFAQTQGAAASAVGRPIPKIVKRDGRYALMVDDAPYLMLSAQVHNSSSWPAEGPKVWPAVEYLHLNTVEMPVYWEQFEPKPGEWDTSLIDNLLKEARAHQVRLVVLWFGTWKNGSQHYMPEWAKLDTAKYAHVIGKNGEAVDSPSPFATASMEADARAFAAFMKHLKAVDAQRTVIMVQVENETGTWGSQRDYSPAAQKLFEAPVPAEVLSAMKVSMPGTPTWAEAFGPEAEVNFHAWAVSKYVGQVAAAGKAQYALPMYVNAALRDPIKPGAPGSYEAGGPTDNVLNIWKAEAPALDVLAPDIYSNSAATYMKVLELYGRDDNPLFVPETGGGDNSRFFFTVLGMGGIGFSPFGLDYTKNVSTDPAHPKEEVLAPWALNYRLVGPMMREVAKANFEGRLQAVAEEQGKPTQVVQFGDWNALVSYGAPNRGPATGNARPEGRLLIEKVKDNEFIVAGLYCRVDFRPAGTEAQRKAGDIVSGNGQNPSAKIEGTWQHRQFLKVEEGTYENGVFKFLRIWNGDETDYGLPFGAEPLVLRVSLATY